MKTATSIEEQIQLLEERGMIFNDKEKAKEIQLDIGRHLQAGKQDAGGGSGRCRYFV